MWRQRKNNWQIMLLVIMIALAALACSVSYSTAKFQDAAFYQGPDGTTKTKTYGQHDTFYCRVELRNASDSTKTKAILYVGEGDQKIEFAQYEMEHGSANLVFEAAPPTDGWKPRTYTVELYLNGDKRETLTFAVK